MRTYRITFAGVQVGAIGAAQQHTVEVAGNCDASAILALYATHEHVWQPKEVAADGALRAMSFGGHMEGCGCK